LFSLGLELRTYESATGANVDGLLLEVGLAAGVADSSTVAEGTGVAVAGAVGASVAAAEAVAVGGAVGVADGGAVGVADDAPVAVADAATVAVAEPADICSERTGLYVESSRERKPVRLSEAEYSPKLYVPLPVMASVTSYSAQLPAPTVPSVSSAEPSEGG
jgi:hypothetical protein